MTAAREFILELLSEDIPARMQARAAEDLGRLVSTGLAEAGLGFDRLEHHSTPRRLAVVVFGVPERQPDQTEEKRGPRVGAPEQAIEGFLKSAGLDSLEACEQRDTGKGVFWFATVTRPGRATAEVLPEIIRGAVMKLVWPKSMRWGRSTLRWVRPLKEIVAVYDGRLVPGELAVGRTTVETKTGEQDVDELMPFSVHTVGHRFLSPGPVLVRDFASYREGLRDAHVILDRSERRRLIAAGAERLAAAEGLVVVPDEGLLDEVAGLVEWPVPLMGVIDERFMALPPEVRQTSMRTNQRYFATMTAEGRPAPRFVVIANMVTEDGGALVVAGNERVLRARLSDAEFFWDQDRRQPLESRLPQLAQIVFHARLGTLDRRVDRLERLAAAIAPALDGCDPALARQAARLAKADLVTGMVGEFPELQGVMGRYYALSEGVAPEVAEAIADHYRPLGPTDRCPSAPVSVAVALADKLDALVGFFAVSERPTGSRDPFALRRAALGVIRLILENGVRLSLTETVAAAHAGYAAQGAPEGFGAADGVGAELLHFFADRLKVSLRERGIRHDLIDAVFATGLQDDLVRLLALVKALAAFLDSDDGANLLTAYRRASNILRIEEQRDGAAYAPVPDAALLRLPEESALSAALDDAEAEAAPLRAREDFGACMEVLARLRPPVDAFFEKVTVNVDEPALRANRLKLVARIRATLNAVADFSRIEG